MKRVVAPVFRGKLLEALEHGLDSGHLQGGPAAESPAPEGRQENLGLLCEATVRWARTGGPIPWAIHPPHRHLESPDRRHRGRPCDIPVARPSRRESGQVPHPERGAVPSPIPPPHRSHGLHAGRHYGFLANPVRRKQVAVCRRLLNAEPEPTPPTNETWQRRCCVTTGRDVNRCPTCQSGDLIAVLPIERSPPPSARSP